MKQLIVIMLITLLASFWACKKSEKTTPSEEKVQAEQKLQAPKKRPGKKAKKKQKQPAAKGLELYLNDQMVAAVNPETLAALKSTSIHLQDKEVQAVPLADILSQNQLNGKRVVISGTKNSCTLDREEITDQDLFLYVGGKNRVHLFQKNAKQGVRCPGSPARITVTDQEPTQAARKAKKKRNQT